MVGHWPVTWKVHHGLKRLKRLLARNRTRQLPQLLREKFSISASVEFLDHHYCHAASAYFTGGLNETLVVTLDGGGDGRSGSVFLGKDGTLAELASVDSYNSLGNFYSYITEICGFRAEKHEGKITGLAAFGKPIYAETLRKFITYESPGKIRYLIPMYQRLSCCANP